MKKRFLLSFLLLSFGCKNLDSYIIQKFPEDQNLERKQNAGNMFGNKDGIAIFDGNNKKETNERNLWSKTTTLILSIFPISIIDEKSGLILTDWSNIKNISGNDDLYKLNIVIKGEKIEKNNISISAFRKNEKDKSIKDNKIAELILHKILN